MSSAKDKEVERIFFGFIQRDRPPFDYEKTLFNDYNARVMAALKGENPPPYEIEIQPTSKCNLRCKHCFGRSLTRNNLEDKMGLEELQLIARRIQEFKQGEFEIETAKFCGTTGEPLVNPITVKGIELFKQAGKKVILYTNGLYLDRESKEGKPYWEYVLEADKINLSLDAGTKETFNLLKGMDGFNRTIKSLELLLKRRYETGSNLKVDISYVIGQENYHDIVETAKIAKNLGVDKAVFRVDFTNPELVAILADTITSRLEEAKALSDSKFQVQSAYSKEEIERAECAFTAQGRKCFNHHFWACIGPDCNLYACGHRTYCGVESYGSLLEHSLEELWNSKKRKMSTDNLPDNPCKFCSPSSLRRNDFMTFLSTLPVKKVEELHDLYLKEKATQAA